MGQKVNPTGFRLCMREYSNPDLKESSYWGGSWHAGPASYAKFLYDDYVIRGVLSKVFPKSVVVKSFITRTLSGYSVTLVSTKSGLCVAKIPEVKKCVALALKKKVEMDITVISVAKADLVARFVAESVAKQIEKRSSYKRVMKKHVASVISAGALGVKIMCSGRLGGAEIARSEYVKEGAVSLHTLRDDIDYAFSEALTTYGIIGVKVWVSRKKQDIRGNGLGDASSNSHSVGNNNSRTGGKNVV